MAYLECNGLKRKYPEFTLDLTFSLEKGELLCILGPSGSGKSTLLSLLSGINKPSDGTISLNGRDITKEEIQKRNIGMVFQDFSLFPSMNTAKNIQYGMKGKDKAEMKEATEYLLELVGLKGYGKRKVHELSGGEAQRVALARALAAEPEMLLLDEPLSALDAPLRKKLRTVIRNIHDELGITMIYVTHDREEAFSIADRIMIMKDGKMEALATPEDLYRKPSNLFTAFFTGDGTTLPASLVYGEGMEGSLFFRPEAVSISEEPLNEGLYPNHLVFNDVEIQGAEYMGSGYMLGMTFRGRPILAFAPLKPKRRTVSLLILRDSVLLL